MTRRKRRPADTGPATADEAENQPATLRQRAEATAGDRERTAPAMEFLDAISHQNAHRTLHELRVHQIELEMQNEQLRESLLQLEAARARYFNFFDLAPVGYVSVDGRGLIIEVNLNAAKVLGVARDTLLGQPFSRFIYREDAELFHLHRNRVFETCEPQICQLRMVRHVDEPFWANLDAIAVQDDVGAPVYRVVMRDISVRKQAQLALAESEDRFRLFMDNLPAAAFIIGEDSDMRYANHEAEICLGTSAWHGKTHSDLFPPELAKIVLSYDKRALEAGSLVTEEHVPDRDGRSRVYEVRRFRLSGQGKPPLLGGIALDITERKQAEEQLLRQAAVLEERVNERTQQLRRISTQLTMAEERERRFLAEDLHDNLHQLLFALKLRLGLLGPNSPRSSFDQIMDMLAKADAAARTITQQLSPPILRTLGLAKALEWLPGEMERTYGLAVHFDPNVCSRCSKPFSDELQASLFRSVREFLVNVAKHAGVGEAKLSCICNNALTTIVVSDQGCGFDTAVIDGVPSMRNSFGLGNAYERIVAFGGTMDIASSPGNGTTITLTMPHPIATTESLSS